MIRHVAAALALLVSSACSQWIEAIIPIDSGPAFVCYNSLLNKVYCLREHSTSIAVVDGETNVVTHHIAADSSPGPLWFVPDVGKLYCSLRASRKLLVVDGRPDTVVATIGFAYYAPSFMSSNSDGSRFYCASRDTVFFLDTAEDTVTAKLVMSGQVRAICYDPYFDRIYAALGGHALDTLAMIDAGTQAVVATVPVGWWPADVVVADSGRKVYCLCFGDSTLSVVDAVTSQRVATVNVGAGPRRLCTNPRDSKVYAACQLSRSVAIVDVRSDSVVATVAVGAAPWQLLYNPVNNKVYCSSGDGQLAVIDGESDSLLQLLPAGGGTMAWNPVQNRVYVANLDSGCVYVVRDSALGLTGESGQGTRGAAKPTVVVGSVLEWPSCAAADVLDATGRHVATLQPGANRLSGMPAGVYYVVPAGASGARRLIRLAR